MITNGVVLQICASLLFLSTILLHITKKKMSEVKIYCLQSVAVVTLLGISLFDKLSLSLTAVIIVMIIVKVILTPIFFVRLIKQHKVKFISSTYLNIPATMIVVALLLLLVGTNKIAPLPNITANYITYLMLSLASMLISIFFIINRKGAISQALGVLSLENSIVMFGTIAGLEQSPLFQFGIIFDVFIMTLLAFVFMSMVYKHFGTLDTTNMNNLKG